LQVVFGLGNSPESWRGSVSAENAEIHELKGWLLRQGDEVAAGRFLLHTRHPVRPEPMA
jgi:hypothetical protein